MPKIENLEFTIYEECYLCRKESNIKYIYDKQKDIFNAWCEKCGGSCIPTFYIDKERGLNWINELLLNEKKSDSNEKTH